MNEPDDIHVTDKRRFNADGEPSGNGEDLAADVPREAALVDTELVPAAEAREWERRAREAEARLGELADAYRRGKADLESTRERLRRDQELRVREAVGRAFERILAALDNLDRALAHAEDGPLAEGVRLVHRQLLDAMAAEGLERIETLAKPFDPNVAEAVATTPAEQPEQANTVVEEFRAGYRIGERVLRPAQVRVAV